MVLARRTHGREKCRTHDPAVLARVGDSECNVYFEGKASETMTHSCCSSCGAKWAYVVETGLSKGTFWNPEA